MNTSRIAVIASSLAVALWAAKATAIGLAGGLDRSPAESPLFLLGLAAFLVAVVTLTLAATQRWSLGLRIPAAFGIVVALVVAIGLADSAVKAVFDGGHWVLAEVNLWIAALLVLGLSVAQDRHRSPRAASHGAEAVSARR